MSCRPRTSGLAWRNRDSTRGRTGICKQRELRQHWQRACKLILAKADVAAVSRALELASSRCRDLKQSHSRHQLNVLQQRDHIGRDLGISAAELRVLAGRNKAAAGLLIRHMETLRLEPSRVDPSVMRDLQRCCSNCDSKQLCGHELEDPRREASMAEVVD